MTHPQECKVTLCLTWQIHEDKVSLRVNADFLHSYGGEPLDVDFCYNRFEHVSVEGLWSCKPHTHLSCKQLATVVMR